MRRSVLLPQPDGPMSETNSPGAMDRSMSSSAVIGPDWVSKTWPTPARWTAGESVIRRPALRC